jgi:hypothetical protein
MIMKRALPSLAMLCTLTLTSVLTHGKEPPARPLNLLCNANFEARALNPQDPLVKQGQQQFELIINAQSVELQGRRFAITSQDRHFIQFKSNRDDTTFSAEFDLSSGLGHSQEQVDFFDFLDSSSTENYAGHPMIKSTTFECQRTGRRDQSGNRVKG